MSTINKDTLRRAARELAWAVLAHDKGVRDLQINFDRDISAYGHSKLDSLNDPKYGTNNEYKTRLAVGVEIAQKYGYQSADEPQHSDGVASLIIDIEEMCKEAGDEKWVERSRIWRLTPWYLVVRISSSTWESRRATYMADAGSNPA